MVKPNRENTVDEYEVPLNKRGQWTSRGRLKSCTDKLAQRESYSFNLKDISVGNSSVIEKWVSQHLSERLVVTMYPPGYIVISFANLR